MHRKAPERNAPAHLVLPVRKVRDANHRERIPDRRNGNPIKSRRQAVALELPENVPDHSAHHAKNIRGANHRERIPDRRSGNPIKSRLREVALELPENVPDHSARVGKNIRGASQRGKVPVHRKEAVTRSQRQRTVAKNLLAKKIPDRSGQRAMIFGNVNQGRQSPKAAIQKNVRGIGETMTRTKSAHHQNDLFLTVRAIQKPGLKKTRIKALLPVDRAVFHVPAQKPLKQRPPFRRAK